MDQVGQVNQVSEARWEGVIRWVSVVSPGPGGCGRSEQTGGLASGPGRRLGRSLPGKSFKD